jgi:hypothetical protein
MEKNLKGGRRNLIQHFSRIFLDVLRKITSIFSPAETQTEHLPNRSTDRYRYASLLAVTVSVVIVASV